MRLAGIDFVHTSELSELCEEYQIQVTNAKGQFSSSKGSICSSGSYSGSYSASSMSMMSSNGYKKRQTTVLIGGSNGNAVLCSILGDRSNPVNEGHTIRVCTRNPTRFLNDSDGSPRLWRCQEQKAFDLFPWEVLPSSWTTHVGAPDSVIGYQTDDDESSTNNNNNNENDELNGMERAISGLGTEDDGGKFRINHKVE